MLLDMVEEGESSRTARRALPLATIVDMESIMVYYIVKVVVKRRNGVLLNRLNTIGDRQEP